MFRKLAIPLIILINLIACTQNQATQEVTRHVTTTTIPVISPEIEAWIDDFEATQTTWQAGKPPNYNDSSAVSVQTSNEWATSGNKSLRMRYEKSDLPKAIYFLEEHYNLSKKRFLKFDLKNDGSISQVAIALSTGPDWYWHESPPVLLSDGINTISFDLQAFYYMTERSNWQPIESISRLEDTRRIAIILFPVLSGEIEIDSLRLGDNPEGAQVIPIELPPTSTPLSKKPASFLELQVLTPPARVYEKLELKILTDGIFINPFDSQEVDLNVILTTPQFEIKRIPAFWYQDYHQMGNAPSGPPEWRARFTPTEAGKWRAQAVLGGLISQAIEFEVLPPEGAARGFVRVGPGETRYLSFDNNETFFPIGTNLGWSTSEPLSNYSHWLEQLSRNGGNTIRIWMASWSFGLEWNDTGLGDYTKRLNRAWQLDQIFDMAKQHGIYIELVLINHGAFSEKVNAEWESNPYNNKNGGMCIKPDCFVTNQQAKEFFKRRLRYIAARWGYSPNLLAWEWWNEADWTPISDKQMSAWIQEMTPYLQSFDPNDHLFSTSYAKTPRPSINNLPEIDYAQIHYYSGSDPAIQFPELFKHWKAAIPDKPIIFAEFGTQTEVENTDSIDKQGLQLHNGLWASTFSGFSSTAMYWWWDSYVDPLGLWHIYHRLDTFLDGEDLTLLSPGNVRLSDGKVTGLSLQNDTHALVYLHDRKYEVKSLIQSYLKNEFTVNSPGSVWFYLPEPIQGLELTISGLKDGDYIANWYLPTQGEWLDEVTRFSIIDGEAKMKVPVFQGDLAVKFSFSK